MSPAIGSSARGAERAFRSSLLERAEPLHERAPVPRRASAVDRRRPAAAVELDFARHWGVAQLDDEPNVLVAGLLATAWSGFTKPVDARRDRPLLRDPLQGRVREIVWSAACEPRSDPRLLRHPGDKRSMTWKFPSDFSRRARRRSGARFGARGIRALRIGRRAAEGESRGTPEGYSVRRRVERTARLTSNRIRSRATGTATDATTRTRAFSGFDCSHRARRRRAGDQQRREADRRRSRRTGVEDGRQERGEREDAQNAVHLRLGIGGAQRQHDEGGADVASASAANA